MKGIQHLCGQRRFNLTALCGLVLALAAFAHAEGHAHKRKEGNLKITAPIEVGGTLLQPGSYTVREVDSQEGLMVEFVQERWDPTVPEGESPYDEEVVARAKASEQALGAPTKHTQLDFGPEAERAVALQVKGDTVEYLFESSPEASAAGAMAGHAESSR